MIPLHISSTSDQSRLFNNPIYYIRNAVGPVAGDYNLIVINTPMDTGWESWGDIIPTDYNPLGPSNWGTFINADTESDVEFITVTNAYDQQVEPNPDRDGSLAGIPQKRHKIISISGFVRGRSQNYTIGVSEFYNMSFNPVLSYLEGSSTFQHSLFPNWQPFYNVGYNVLAWYDPSFRGDFRKVSAAEGGSIDPWSVDPYARLNRMIFVRPLSRPVLTRSKFEDFNTAFRIELLATDPTIYEFIPPELWFADGQTTPLFIDTIRSEGNETLIVPEYPWGFSGPGWREVSNNVLAGCDTFNRTESSDWGVGSYGAWLNTSQMSSFYGFGTTVDPDNYAVGSGVGTMQYDSAAFQSLGLGPQQGLHSDGGFGLPITVEFKHQLVNSTGDMQNVQIYFGPEHYTDYDAWVALATYWDDDEENNYIYVNAANQGPYSWPINHAHPDENLDFPTAATQAQAQEPWIIKVLIDSTGFFAKTWREGTSEPASYQVEMYWSSVPADSMFRYVYLETQGFNTPFIGNPQPTLEVDYFCFEHT